MLTKELACLGPKTSEKEPTSWPDVSYISGGTAYPRSGETPSVNAVAERESVPRYTR